MRKQALATDVRTSEELAVAVANGIHPARIVVHGDTMSDPELLCAANVGMGRVIIDSFAEADYRALCNEKRIQAVLLGMKDPGLCGGGCIDDAMVAVLAHRRLFLSGGHKTSTMTLDQYGHLFPDDLDDVADKMDNLVLECAQNVPTKETGQGENAP